MEFLKEYSDTNPHLEPDVTVSCVPHPLPLSWSQAILSQDLVEISYLLPELTNVYLKNNLVFS